MYNIALLVYTYSHDALPKPMELIFIRNRDYHIYYARHSEALHTARGNNEFTYKTKLVSLPYKYGTIYQEMYPLMSHACLKHFIYN